METFLYNNIQYWQEILNFFVSMIEQKCMQYEEKTNWN